jgi:hypothetical protein
MAAFYRFLYSRQPGADIVSLVKLKSYDIMKNIIRVPEPIEMQA